MATKKVTPAAAKTTAKTTAKKVVKKPAATAKTTKTTTKAKPAITEADIRKKAEEIYNARVASGEVGSPESDWINAEKALKAKK